MQAQRRIKTQADKGCKGTSNKIWWHLQYQVQKGSGNKCVKRCVNETSVHGWDPSMNLKLDKH